MTASKGLVLLAAEAEAEAAPLEWGRLPIRSRVALVAPEAAEVAVWVMVGALVTALAAPLQTTFKPVAEVAVVSQRRRRVVMAMAAAAAAVALLEVVRRTLTRAIPAIPAVLDHLRLTTVFQ